MGTRGSAHADVEAFGNLFHCNDCEYQFSVRVGTVLQDSKLPLWKWFLATFLIIESKKGISAAQLSRTIGVSNQRAGISRTVSALP